MTFRQTLREINSYLRTYFPQFTNKPFEQVHCKAMLLRCTDRESLAARRGCGAGSVACYHVNEDDDEERRRVQRQSKHSERVIGFR